MAEYDPKPELFAAQQSLLKGYEHQLNQEIKENLVILSCLSQQKRARGKGATPGNPAGPRGGKTKCFQIGCTKNFNELLSVAKEQPCQLGMCAQSAWIPSMRPRIMS